MKKILSVGLAVLLLLSVATCLPVFATEDVVAEPTFTCDFTAHCSPEDYVFENAHDVAISGGTKGYYTFTAKEDEMYVGLRPMADMPTPSVSAKDMAYAVMLYRTETSAEGAFLVARADGKQPGMTGTRVSWTYVADGEWHLALIDASEAWGDATATVTRLRYDMFVDAAEEDSVDVSYIKFFATAEDAQSYVAANSTAEGGLRTIDAVVEKDGVVYGYATKTALTFLEKRVVTEVLDWSLENADPNSPNSNRQLIGEDVVTSWEAGGYINADRLMYAVFGGDNKYLLFDSLPFADYERVRVVMTSAGVVDEPWIVGFVSDVNHLYGNDYNFDTLDYSADIAHGICMPATTHGEENLSGMGIGSSWNTSEREVCMNIEGVTWDGTAALYVGARAPHIPVILKVLFEREVEADIYVDEDGNEYVAGQDFVVEEDGAFYTYTGLFDVMAVEADGEITYAIDLTEYFAEEPVAPPAPNHTITFVDEKGNVVATYEFTEGSTVVDWTEPEVPAKAGMEGYWEAYQLGAARDLVVKAKYRLAATVETDPVESDTEAVTDETVADTQAADTEADTAAAVTTAAATDNKASGGCKSTVSGAAVLVLSVLGLGVATLSKKED